MTSIPTDPEYDCDAEAISWLRREKEDAQYEYKIDHIQDQEFIDRRYNELSGHLAQRHAGLYRNACLGLAAYSVVNKHWHVAYEYILDILFFDTCGGYNAHPNYECFDKQMCDTVPFIVWQLAHVSGQLGYESDQVERDFSTRWARFPTLSTPPISPEKAWKRIIKTK